MMCTKNIFVQALVVITAFGGISAAQAQYAQRVNQARQTAARTQGTNTARTAAARQAYNERVAAAGAAAAVNPVYGRGAFTAARPVAGGASIANARTAMNAFKLDMGRLPTAAEGLNALITRPPGAVNWRGPYVSVTGKTPFTDPWGNLYRYIDTTALYQYPSFSIKSNGPDGLPDTADDLAISG